MARTTTSPGVEPDPDLDLHAVRAARVLRVALERFLHPEGGVAGADRVVLVGERRAEERHDAVAHHLVHCALVVMHRRHHAFEDGIEDLTRLLGVTIRQQLHGALQVGEKHRDLLTLTFQRGLGVEDLLGEVLRDVGLGGDGIGGRRSPERRSALAAKLVLRRVCRATRRTGRGKRCGALPAELHAWGILVPASRTLHPTPSERVGNGRTGGESLGWQLRSRQAHWAAGRLPPGPDRGQVEPTCPYCVRGVRETIALGPPTDLDRPCWSLTRPPILLHALPMACLVREARRGRRGRGRDGCLPRVLLVATGSAARRLPFY
jgi:hypothetical protein